MATIYNLMRDKRAAFNNQYPIVSQDYWETDPDVLNFRKVYKAKFGEEPSRNINDAQYDYDAAYKAGVRPQIDETDGLYHWDSRFKTDNHPNRFINGFDTKTGILYRPNNNVINNTNSDETSRQLNQWNTDNILMNFPNYHSYNRSVLENKIIDPTSRINTHLSTYNSKPDASFKMPPVPQIDFSEDINYGDNMESLQPVEIPILHETIIKKTKEPLTKQPLTTTQKANIATGILGGANALAGIIGAAQLNKMRPTFAQVPQDIETTLAKDNTQALYSAGRKSIARSSAGIKNAMQRAGMDDKLTIYAGKEMEANNQLSGKLAELRQGINVQNANAINRTKEINMNKNLQVGSQNAQIANQFQQNLYGMKSAAMSGIMGAAQGTANTIYGNIYKEDMLNRADEINMLNAWKDIYDQSSGSEKQEAWEKIKEISNNIYSRNRRNV